MRKKQAFVGHEQKGHCPAFIEAGHQIANCPDFERMVIHIRQSKYKTHLHCIVPAAGYSLSGKWRHIGKYDNYLYPVHQLSAAFKGKFLDSIKRELRKLSAMDGFKACLEKAHQKKWMVYCEPSMAGAEQVIRYLGQYTHRIASSN